MYCVLCILWCILWASGSEINVILSYLILIRQASTSGCSNITEMKSFQRMKDDHKQVTIGRCTLLSKTSYDHHSRRLVDRSRGILLEGLGDTKHRPAMRRGR